MFGIWKWLFEGSRSGNGVGVNKDGDTLMTSDGRISAGAGGGCDCFVIARGSPTRPVPGVACRAVFTGR